MTRPFFRLATATVTLVIGFALAPGHAQPSTDFRLGTAIEATEAERSITIAADTRWANVRQGEAIRFVSGQNTFGWKFDGTHSAVDLARIAPARFLAHPFTVYVAPSLQGRRAN